MSGKLHLAIYDALLHSYHRCSITDYIELILYAKGKFLAIPPSYICQLFAYEAICQALLVFCGGDILNPFQNNHTGVHLGKSYPGVTKSDTSYEYVYTVNPFVSSVLKFLMIKMQNESSKRIIRMLCGLLILHISLTYEFCKKFGASDIPAIFVLAKRLNQYMQDILT